jgi:hypothetical protein
MIVHFATSMKEVSITNKCKIAILSHFFILPRDIQNLASKIKQQNFVDSPFKDNTRAINTILKILSTILSVFPNIIKETNIIHKHNIF